jgi:hypothetical protein
MTSRISHTTIDAHNAYTQSLWWSQVLDMKQDPDNPNEPGHKECLIISADGHQQLLFIEVPEGKQVKNRIHFDLRPTDRTRDEEIERCSASAQRRSPTGETPTVRGGSCWLTPKATSSASCAARRRSQPLTLDPYCTAGTPCARKRNLSCQMRLPS